MFHVVSPSRSPRTRSRSLAAALPLIGLLALSLACATGAPPSGNPEAPASPVDAPEAGQADRSAPHGEVNPGTTASGELPDPSKPKPQQAQRGSKTARKHAASGLHGMVVGTMIGGQVGGAAGAAVGAAVFGLYGVVTGKPPLESGRGARGRRGGGVDDALEQEVEDELERQQTLESEINEELRRQEELLQSISREEELSESIREEEEERLAAERNADPLAAPVARPSRELPDSIFEIEHTVEGRQERIRETLDADRDGRPEIVVTTDGKSGHRLTRAEDTNYDGNLDSTTTYEETGKISALQEDTDHDGVPDRWTRYKDGLGDRVEVDRDSDGVRDGFYTYDNGALAYEEHDVNNDGVIDRRVEYAGRQRAVEVEDRDFNGAMDSRIFYGEGEIPIRTELDTNEDGQTDVWEYYEGNDPANVLLVRKEEDLNADNEIDATSHYRNGKLVRKEISDPSLY